MKFQILKYLTFTLLLLPLTSSICYAKTDRAYRVEVLIFETQDKNALAEEWPLDPGKPAIASALNLASEPGAEYSQLPDNQLMLHDAKRKIQKRYPLVLHKGWRQVITDKDHAQRVHLVGGKVFNRTSVSGGADSQSNVSGQMSVGSPQYEVDGTIRFIASKYLHVETDLLFRKPMKMVTAEAGIGAELNSGSSARFAEVASNLQQQDNVRLQAFRLKETNRIKMDEIQYIDHPFYGVMVMVSPEKN